MYKLVSNGQQGFDEEGEWVMKETIHDEHS